VLVAVEGQETIFDHNVAAEDLGQVGNGQLLLGECSEVVEPEKTKTRAPLPVA
jgi:hypothetical protein